MADSSTLTLKQTRRKRPSFSPIKSRKPQLPARAHSESPTKQKSDDSGVTPIYRAETSALDFNEFSLIGDNGLTPSVGDKCHQQLFAYLEEHYEVKDMWIMQPFIFIRCSDRPDPSERPFTISGCLAFWLGMDDPVPPIKPWAFGAESDVSNFVQIDERLLGDLERYRMPKPETLHAVLTQHFPEAAAISFIFDTIVVEFDEVSEDVWREKIESLPWSFKNLSLGLNYSNGLLANTEWKRLVKPRPGDLKNFLPDDSNYVSATGSFNPGAMISSDEEDAVTAGVFVEKNQERRLTVAFHCWEKEFKAEPNNLGDSNYYRVRQADSRVGYVTDRVEATDIGLAKLDDNISFSNRFLDIDTAGKVLVPFSAVQPFDQFYIDSFVTGRQPLLCAGVRVLGPKRGDDFLRDRQADPPDGRYVIMHQGIYATNDPIIIGKPQLRAGICGSVLVRLRRANEKSSCLEDGEVCGIMHWADLAMKYSTEARFFCFADPVDPLIDNGWKCVPVAEKRIESDEDDHPAKKRK